MVSNTRIIYNFFWREEELKKYRQKFFLSARRQDNVKAVIWAPKL